MLFVIDFYVTTSLSCLVTVLFRHSYTNLLNKWRFYNERVQFDLEWMKACDGARPTSQVYVYCNFCGKSISSQGTASGGCRVGVSVKTVMIFLKNRFFYALYHSATKKKLK